MSVFLSEFGDVESTELNTQSASVLSKKGPELQMCLEKDQSFEPPPGMKCEFLAENVEKKNIRQHLIAIQTRVCENV